MATKRKTPSKPAKATPKTQSRPPRKAGRENYRGDAVKLVMEHFPQQAHSQEELIRRLPTVVEKRDLIGIRAILRDAAGSFSAGELLAALFGNR